MTRTYPRPASRISHLSGILVVLALLTLLAFMVFTPVEAAADDLFFSEYIEGSNNNRALEIYNGTSATVDLSDYSVEYYPAGTNFPAGTQNLSGTLASGEVLVIANPGADAAITGVADVLSGAVTAFEGDDTLVLRKSGVGNLDVIGQINFDPGVEWGTGDTTAANHTLVRKPAICAGDTIGSDAFDPAVEWDGFAVDTFTDLGTHTSDCLSGDTTPTDEGTLDPTNAATDAPTDAPTDPATEPSTEVPTAAGTEVPTETATDALTEVPTSVPTEPATDVPTPEPTATDAGPIELLINGDMETNLDADPKVPDGWTLVNGKKDKLKCDSADKVVAHSPVCAFRFKGSASEAAKLKQSVDLEGLSFATGDLLELTVYINAPKSTAQGKLKLIIKYQDDEPQKIKQKITKTQGYAVLTASAGIISPDVIMIKVQVDHLSSANKVDIDDASLLWSRDASGRIALPR